MSSQRSQTTTPKESGALAVGFLALAGAIGVAHVTPADGYELSLYAGTPTTVWILLGVSFCLSLAVALATTAPWYRRLSLCLGAGAAIAFVGMPVLRGYHFISGGDALTHLGWARGIRDGMFSPLELRYPGLHTVSTLFSTALGIDLTHAMMLVIVLLFGLFFLFVALSTDLVFENRYSVTVGAFSAFLLLPITTLSTFVTPHPMSQSILFSAVIVYSLLKYMQGNQVAASVSSLGVLLAMLSIAVVLYHPQLAAHLLVVFVGICAVQFLFRRFGSTTPIATHRSVYGQTAILTGGFLLWVANHGLLVDVIRFHLVSTLEYFLGGTGSAGDAIDSQSNSIAQIGGSVVEIVLKLLGPSLVFGVLAALLVGWTLIENDGRLLRETEGVIHYFTVALVGLGGLFAVYFFGSTEKMYFRVFGFTLLFITIMGAAAIAYGMDALSKNRSTTAVHSIAVLGFGVLLVVSLLAVFPSPYIYGTSPHVTTQAMDGHETAFDRGDDDIPYIGIRSGPNRYVDATTGDLERTERYEGISGPEIEEGISRQYEDDRYLVVKQRDLDRELIAFKELRYTEAQLNSIESQPGVNRVQTNGGFELYHVRGTADA
ncbi:hypothetical protein [Natrinema salinisoli]|uniref:hypothetical protein n=1 Tax=Natrinema salinisoli TaxID=2878535 RepID=UPI001CF0B711|nr:hypothetical protein [Natrinema salinisoli]